MYTAPRGNWIAAAAAAGSLHRDVGEAWPSSPEEARSTPRAGASSPCDSSTPGGRRTAPVGYHLTALARFLFIALPILVVVMGLFSFGLVAFELMPPMDELARLGLERTRALPIQVLAGGWLIESLALTALFLLIQGRSGAWWLDGIVTGLIGWVFRGPILVLSVVSWSRLGSSPWWPMSLRWLVLYLICGLVLAIVARRVGVERVEAR